MNWTKNVVTGDFTANDRLDLYIRRSHKNKKKFDLVQNMASGEQILHTGTLLECQNTAETVPAPVPVIAVAPVEFPPAKGKGKAKGKKEPKPEEATVIVQPTPEPVPEPTPAPTVVEEPNSDDDWATYQTRSRGPRPWEGKSPIFAPGNCREKVNAIGAPKDFSKPEIFAFFERTLDWYEGREIYIANSAMKTLWGHLKTSGTDHGIARPEQFRGAHEDHALKTAQRKFWEDLDQFWSMLLDQRKEPNTFSPEYREQVWLNRVGSGNVAPAAPGKPATPSTPRQSAATVSTAKVGDSQVVLASTTGGKGGKRFNFMGVPITSVLRWMGHRGWTKKQARKAMDDLGIDVKDPTIQAQIHSGKKGDSGHHGKLPNLTNEQRAAIDQLFETVRNV